MLVAGGRESDLETSTAAAAAAAFVKTEENSPLTVDEVGRMPALHCSTIDHDC